LTIVDVKSSRVSSSSHTINNITSSYSSNEKFFDELEIIRCDEIFEDATIKVKRSNLDVICVFVTFFPIVVKTGIVPSIGIREVIVHGAFYLEFF